MLTKFEKGWSTGLTLTFGTHSLYRVSYSLFYVMLRKFISDKSPTILQLSAPVIASNLAGICCYPLDTIRRNQFVHGGSILDVFNLIVDSKGWNGFFCGLGWHCLRLSSVSLLRIMLFYAIMQRSEKKKKRKRQRQKIIYNGNNNNNSFLNVTEH